MRDIIKKFIELSGLKVFIELDRSGIDKKGIRFLCYSIEVRANKYDSEYLVYHCYERKGNRVVYSEGNQVKDVRKGALAFLGNDKEVSDYLESLTKKKAIQDFENFESYD